VDGSTRFPSLSETRTPVGYRALARDSETRTSNASDSFENGELCFMKLNTLKDLYFHELKDLFSAEQQIVKALPKMMKAAASKELAAGFQEHLVQTREHVQRLEEIMSRHEQTTRGPKCKGMEGLLEEGAEMIEQEADDEVKDAGLIAAAQRVEHYEIAGYGTARTYAGLLDDQEGEKLLGLTLEEEKQTDQKLSKLAKSSINLAAAK
jgi:ferritin-like metal-binding protein YciE